MIYPLYPARDLHDQQHRSRPELPRTLQRQATPLSYSWPIKHESFICPVVATPGCLCVPSEETTNVPSTLVTIRGDQPVYRVSLASMKNPSARLVPHQSVSASSSTASRPGAIGFFFCNIGIFFCNIKKCCKATIFATQILQKNVARNLKNRLNVAKSMLQRFSKMTKMLQTKIL